MTHEEQQEQDDWDAEERSEIIVKYNVYATPLSPIPEESYCDDAYSDQIQIRYNFNLFIEVLRITDLFFL